MEISTPPITNSNVYCLFLKSDGTPCEAKPLNGEAYCFSHSQDENLAKRRTDARQRGGKNGRRYDDIPAESEVKITNMQHVVDMLSETINEVRMNRISPKKANCIGYLLNIAVKAIEKKDLEVRVEQLENILSRRG